MTQGDRLLASYRVRRLIPNRSHAIPSDWQRHVRPQGDVRISLAQPGSPS